MLEGTFMRVKLMAEYLCSPLWGYDAGGEAENLALDALALPTPLVRRIEAWNAAFQATFRPHDRERCGFASQRALDDHHREGASLAEELQRALSHVSTGYEPTGSVHVGGVESGVRLLGRIAIRRVAVAKPREPVPEGDRAQAR